MDLSLSGDLVFHTKNEGERQFLRDMASANPLSPVTASAVTIMLLGNRHEFDVEDGTPAEVRQLCDAAYKGHLDAVGRKYDDISPMLASTIAGGTEIVLPSKFTPLAIRTAFSTLADRMLADDETEITQEEVEDSEELLEALEAEGVELHATLLGDGMYDDSAGRQALEDTAREVIRKIKLRSIVIRN